MKKIIISALALAFAASTAMAQTKPSPGTKVATKVDRSMAPKPAPAPKIQIPDAEKFVLENGLTVLLVENHKLPRVSFQLSVEYTPFLEGNVAGNADIAGSLMKTGTSTRTKEQIDKEIDFVGASLSTGANGIFASSLTKHAEKVLEVTSDVLLNPVFPQSELDKLKKQTISGLKQQKESADAIAANVAKVLRYGKKHPMGELTTEETVANISQESVKNFYTTYYKPNVSYLVIVGDVNRPQAEAWAKKYFGAWKSGNVPTNALPEVKTPSGAQVVFVPKTGAVQSVINVTYPVDFKPGNPDAIKASVMNSILGGGVFSGRLMQNLRESKAYTYGANSQLATNKYMGYFNAFASVRNEVTDSSVTEFLYEISRMRNDLVTEAEFTRIKNYMNGSFARSLESPQTIANFALNKELYNLPADYYKNYLANLSAVTLADVQDMAKKYLKPDNTYILVVGNKEVADKLLKFDSDNEITYLDAFGNPASMVETRPAPQGVTVQGIFEKAVLAFTESTDMKAAEKKLKALKDVTIKAKAEIQGNEIEFTQYKKAPGKSAQVITFQGQVFQKKTFNGKNGKTISMMGAKDMEAEEIKEAQEESQMVTEMNYLLNGKKAELKGVESLNGKDAYVLDIFNEKGESSTVYYDVTSGNKVKVISTAEVPQMGKVTNIVEFENYKSVNGYTFPFVQKISGPQSLSLNVESVEVNKKLSDDLFN